jgi:hypothetical protein
MSDNTSPVDDASADAKSTAKQRDVYEIIAAVLLGVATIAIAWSAQQANLWGGMQDKQLAQSVRTSNQSVDAFQLSDSERLLDRLIFLDLVAELEEPDGEFTPVAEELFLNLSEGGATAVELWTDGGTESPLDDDAYVLPLLADGEELSVESDALYAEAVQSNSNGDNYVLASTMLASVLFFAGISTVLSSTRTRQVLLAIASLSWLGSVIYMTTLPIA